MDEINKLAIKLDNNAQIINLLSRGAEINLKTFSFKISVKQLISKQKKLVALNALLCQDLITPKKDKLDRRDELTDITFQVVRFLQVFASDRKKKNMQQRLKSFTSAYFQNCSDRELIKNSMKIWLIANKYLEATFTVASKKKYSANSGNSFADINFEKEYGLRLDMIIILEEAKLRFIESINSYKGAIKRKEKMAGRIKFLNKQTEKLLARKIDSFMLLYEFENPGLYQEYSRLREVHINEPVNQTSD